MGKAVAAWLYIPIDFEPGVVERFCEQIPNSGPGGVCFRYTETCSAFLACAHPTPDAPPAPVGLGLGGLWRKLCCKFFQRLHDLLDSIVDGFVLVLGFFHHI